MLELGEDLLDGVKIGTIGRQEEEMRAGFADGLPCGFAFMRAEIVQDDDVALGEGRDEHLLDIGGEDVAADRPVDDPRRVDAVMAQRGDEGQCLPVPMRHTGAQPLPARSPAAQGCHIGLDPCLIEEDEPSGVNPVLMRLPARPLSGDVRA